MTTRKRITAYGEYYEVISCSLRSQLEGELLEIFEKIKLVLDAVVATPSIESLSNYSSILLELPPEYLQCLHQYLFFPLVSLIKCQQTRKRVEIHLKVLEIAMILLERISINNYELCLKLQGALLSIIFDSTKPGMISDATEEVKYSTICCLTCLMLNLQTELRQNLLHLQVPMLAQQIFVSVHIAKLEKLRVLRIAAIDNVLAYTMTHTHYDKISAEEGEKPGLELQIVDRLLANILPGVLAALQDVAVDRDNPGYAVVTDAVKAIHRILCLTMHNKYLNKKQLTIKDFVAILKDHNCKHSKTEVSNKGPKINSDIKKRSREWYKMAGEKLTLITKSLVVLRTHEHCRVRKELAIFCNKVISDCYTTLPESVPLCLDVLIALSADTHCDVSAYCVAAVAAYLTRATPEALDSLCNNFITLLSTLPRILNNIDSTRKLSALSLLLGYLETLSVGARLSVCLSAASTAHLLCETLTLAARHEHTTTTLKRVVTRDVSSPPVMGSPWSSLVHLDAACAARLQAACVRLAGSPAAGTIVDVLMQDYDTARDPAHLWIMNCIIKAPNCPHPLVKRILATYLDDELWYDAIDEDLQDVSDGDTLDVAVYNPRAWTKDTVPDLYEGTIETRVTDIPLSQPVSPRHSRVSRLHTAVTLACLLTEGVGSAALALQTTYQPYLLKTVCLILERIGSEYELVHQAGVKAAMDIASATGCSSVADLIRQNADYVTNRVTASLKKAWDCESALAILTVVVEYSDVTGLDCLYGIVEDVLVQSCDRYHQNNLNSYLQVFLSFLEFIQKWFPYDLSANSNATPQLDLDLLKEVEDYVRNTLEAERLLSDSDCDKSAQEMYEEDAKSREEGVIDYDETVTAEKPPLPPHIKVTISIINRSLHFIPSPNRETSLLAIRIASLGVVTLRRYEDELLPLVHLMWAPLVGRFKAIDVVVLRHACDLLVVLAECSKDFIRSRTLKEVLPTLYKFLLESSKSSYLKDAGSCYRTSAMYSLQKRALRALAPLTVQLQLDGDSLDQAEAVVGVYLSNKQPKDLQKTAVDFFKTVLSHDYGSAWLYLRALCSNDVTLHPPTTTHVRLQPVQGTPYHASDTQYDANVKLVFGIQ